MAILNTGIPTNLTEYPNSFKRQGAFPLESFSVFYSMTDAENYASSNPVAYVGQNIVVINGNEVDMYLITSTAGTLKKLASTTASGDLASDVAILQSKVGALETEILTARGEKANLKERIEEVETIANNMAVTVDTTTTSDGASKSYKLSQNGKDLVTIDIPKDMVVSSGTIEVYTEENKPEGVATAGTYVVLTIANATSDKLYINVSTLLDDKTVEGTEGEMITVVADSSEGPVKISASIVDGSVTEVKLAEAIKGKLAKAVSAVQAIETGATNGTIKVDGVEVAVFGLGEAAFKGITTSVTKDSEALVTSGGVESAIAGVQSQITTNKGVVDGHIANTDIHVTTADKEKWNEAADEAKEALNNSGEHISNTDIHVTTEDKTKWNDKYTKEEIDNKVTEINGNFEDLSDTVDGHTANTDIHVTTEDKEKWNGAVDLVTSHTQDTDIHVTTEDKTRWNDKYTKTETDTAIATAIANADHLKREIVESLPTENIDEHTIYMIKKGSSENGDNYEEYMLIDGALVKMGDTTVDLTDYLTKTGDISDTTVTFAESAEDKPELTTGDKISVLIGKIKKWFSSLHKVAISGDYNDLNNRIMVYKATQSTATKTHLVQSNTSDSSARVRIQSVELYMDGEKVIGDVSYEPHIPVTDDGTTILLGDGVDVTISFSVTPPSEVEVRILYTSETTEINVEW